MLRHRKNPTSLWGIYARHNQAASLTVLWYSGVRAHMLSRVQLFVIPWTEAHQASPSMGFSRQEYWNGLPCSPPGDLPDPGIEPTSPALAGGFFTTEPSTMGFAVNHLRSLLDVDEAQIGT